jgi:hypothetical protein
MKSIVLLLVILSAVSVSYAQIGGVLTGPGISTGIPIIQPFGVSTSALDSTGNLFVFDVSFSRGTLDPTQMSFPRISVTTKTHVTVITNSGTRLGPVDLEGNLQVLGAGRHALYVLSTTYANGPTVNVQAFAPVRHLMALRIGNTGLVSPFVEVPINADIRLAAAADSSAPDTISVVDAPANPFVLMPSAAPAVRRFARFVKYSISGGFDTGTPIPLP